MMRRPNPKGTAMEKNIFHERERAEEAAYFRRQDATLIERLRERAKLSEVARALAEKLQTDNPDLLQRIAKLGITLDTGAAFLLAPLAQVAWADHQVSPEEHDLILRFARERGVEEGSADMSQIQSWLRVRPPEAVFDVALESIAVGLTVLPQGEAEARVASVMRACTAVAEVSEGLTKWWQQHSMITPEERRTLDAIRAKLSPGGDTGTTAGPPTGKGDLS